MGGRGFIEENQKENDHRIRAITKAKTTS